MNSYNLYLLTTASIGFNIIFVYSSIFAPIRNYIESKSETLGTLVSCPMCFGFWSGLVFGFIYGLDPFLFGFSTSFMSWISSNLVAFLSSTSSYLEQCEYINAVEKRELFTEGEEDE